MDVSPYRRAYFALCKSLGLDDDTRHALNIAVTGKPSTSQFSVDDWRLVVSRLQRDAGQDVEPGRPHIKGEPAGTPGGMITPAQLEWLTALAGQIAWRKSPEAFVRQRLLAPTRKDVWSGRWEDLFRSEAGNIITVFKRMAGRAHQ